MKILNLTPHPITILDENGGEKLRILPHPCPPARLSATTERVKEIDGIPFSKTVFGEATDLPEEEEEVYLIVSQLIKSAFPERCDLVVPAEVVRDERGYIAGCKSLGL